MAETVTSRQIPKDKIEALIKIYPGKSDSEVSKMIKDAAKAAEARNPNLAKDPWSKSELISAVKYGMEFNQQQKKSG